MQGDGTIDFRVLYRLLEFRDRHYLCSSPAFGILRWPRQEERKPHNQDFSVAPAWVISSGQIESGPGVFPGFRCLRAAANSREVKLSETFLELVEVALRRSDTSCEMRQDDSRSIPSYLPFLVSWDAIELAETAH